ncbi:MAG: hypothetical protein DSY40_01985 [Nautilia sp.]|nr:MAG: hypothetical protein DSY40_01985 [Nautilia sp.]
MKKSFSLIELIFTIVMIAMIFTVIPRIIYATNMSIGFQMKEDGIFNMMTHIIDISTQEYDENNTADAFFPDDILLTGNSNVLECNTTTDYRIGGFVGGRNCRNNEYDSIIGPDANENDESDYDDVDDYNGTEDNATKNGNTRYKLYTFVGYTKEWNKSNYDYDNQRLDFNFTTERDGNYRNIKYIEVILEDERFDKNISHARYWSANIGHTYIESRQW